MRKAIALMSCAAVLLAGGTSFARGPHHGRGGYRGGWHGGPPHGGWGYHHRGWGWGGGRPGRGYWRGGAWPDAAASAINAGVAA